MDFIKWLVGGIAVMRVNAVANPFAASLLFAGKRGRHVTEVRLEDKKGNKVEGDLYRKTDADHPNDEIYDVFVKKNHVGHMELSTDKKGSLGHFPDYGKHVYIDWIGSGDHLREGREQNTHRGDCPYTGVGTTLLQVAYERSKQRGMKGRVGLYALSEARQFYLKRGFKGAPRHKNTSYLYSVNSHNMALGKSGRRYWGKIVRKHPLLAGKRFKVA